MPRRDRIRLSRRIAAAALGLTLAGPAAAQQGDSALSNLSLDSDKPIRIESDVLEVLDAEKVAVFSGNVIVRQGDTTLQTIELRVLYSGDPIISGDSAESSDQQISRLEAKGKVVIEAKDQKATGDWATFLVPEQVVTIGGNVVLSQGQNVLRQQGN